MSASVTTAQAQACLRAALADEVIAQGGIGQVAIECGVSEDTLRRWLSGAAGDWTATAIGALVAAASRRSGRSLVVDRLGDLLAQGAHQADGRRAITDVAQALPELLTEAQRMATTMADGRLSRDEARALLASLPGLQLRLREMESDIGAWMRDAVGK